jgi:hypothetical protein
LNNYRTFRKYLNIPLVTVELSFNGKYELTSSDADILVRLKGNDTMWQKERLLNVALHSLPHKCSKVAWMDCDIVFNSNNWHNEVCTLLDQYKVIQLFKKVFHLPAEINPTTLNINKVGNDHSFFSEYSFAFNHVSDVPVKNYNRVGGISKINGSCGVTWAAHRDILTQHGFYDAFIAGGGDTAIAYAGSGKYKELPLLRPITKQQVKHYYSWAESYSQTVNNSISYLDCEVYHLWHGNFADRRYLSRHEMLNQFNFDPYSDIMHADDGCWQWKSDKAELHDYLRSYFSCRKEDGGETN